MAYNPTNTGTQPMQATSRITLILHMRVYEVIKCGDKKIVNCLPSKAAVQCPQYQEGHTAQPESRWAAIPLQNAHDTWRVCGELSSPGSESQQWCSVHRTCAAVACRTARFHQVQNTGMQLNSHLS